MLPIILSLAGYTLFGIAMVMMKAGAGSLPKFKHILSDTTVLRDFSIWLVGIVFNVGHGFVIMYALGYGGKASLIAALNGFGLAVTAILSTVFLKEELQRLKLIGICTIIAGTGFLGLFDSGEEQALLFETQAFMIFMAATLLPLVVASFWTWLNSYKGAAIIFAIAGGAVGGISTLNQNIWSKNLAADPVWATLLADPYFYIFLVVTNLSFGLIQVAYQFGTAVVVVPLFSAAIILVPVIGGVLVFGEQLAIGQYAGVVCMLFGMVMVSFVQGQEVEAGTFVHSTGKSISS